MKNDVFSNMVNSKYFGHTNNNVRNVQKVGEIHSPTENIDRKVKGNVCTIDQLGELLSQVTDLAWGANWGVISPESANNEDSENVSLPRIVYSVNSREVADGSPIKPILSNTIPEVINGVKTGDYFEIYRQWFDCVIDFGFYGKSTLHSQKLMERFDELMIAYAGKMKKLGVSEMFFLKEVNPRRSLLYKKDVSMRASTYFFRLEKVYKIRQNSIKEIVLNTNDIDEKSNLYTNSKNIL